MYKLIIFGVISQLLMSLGETFAQPYNERVSLQSLTDSVQVTWSLENSSRKFDSVLIAFDQRIDSLKENIKDPKLYLAAVHTQYTKLSERLNGIDSLTLSLDSKTKRIDSLISKKQLQIDSLLKKSRLPTTNSNFNPNILNEKIPNLPSLPLDQMKVRLPQLPELQNHFTSLDLTTANPVSTSLKIFKKKLPPLNSSSIPGDVNEASEGMLEKLQPISELTKSQEKAESLLKQADDYSSTLKDPEALQEKAKEELIDHLEGKEEVVKKDLEDIARLQTKYRDIADSRLLPKHKWKMNAMKNKPFVERMIPGIDLQVFTGENISVNAAPTISYKISGIFQSGISAFRRVTYFKKEASISLVNCYGLRVFMQATLFKSFHAYGELERSKPDPTPAGIFHSTSSQTMENGGFQNKVNIGIVHSYSMGKNISGYFVVLYDVLQIKKFPNSTGSSSRFGIQYELKKRKK